MKRLLATLVLCLGCTVAPTAPQTHQVAAYSRLTGGVLGPDGGSPAGDAGIADGGRADGGRAGGFDGGKVSGDAG